jgi:hypothetical protein
MRLVALPRQWPNNYPDPLSLARQNEPRGKAMSDGSSGEMRPQCGAGIDHHGPHQQRARFAKSRTEQESMDFSSVYSKNLLLNS